MRLKKLLHSLYFKIIGSTLLILIIFGFISFLILQKTTRDKINSIEKQVTSIFSSALGKSLLNQMLFSDPSIFQGLINSLVDGEIISFAFIMNEEEEIISHTFYPLIPEDIIKEVKESKESRVVVSDNYGKVYLTIEPLFNGLLGHFVLGEVMPDLSELWMDLGMITIIFFILIALMVTIIISRSFTNPLYNLISAIGETDSYGIPVHIVKSYKTTEFNQLGLTINNMIDSIRKSRDALKSAHIQLKNIFNFSLQIMIIGTDKNGLITLFNAGAEKILGYKVDEVVGKMKLFDILISSEVDKRIKELTRELKKPISQSEIFTASTNEKGYDEREWTYRKKNGSYIKVNLIVSSITDDYGNITALVGFAQDITLKKRQEMELYLHKEHLEMLVKSRTDELQESLDRLKMTQKQLVESEKMASLGGLVAGVAHEINTPVGIGVTAASHLDTKAIEFAKKYEEGVLSRADFEGFIGIISESSKIILSNMNRAANLINSFKQVAVDQSSEEIRTFKIKEYIDEILLSTRSKFKHTKHKIVVECPEDFVITSYPGAISQILTNLLMNSLIHGFDGIPEGLIIINIKKSKFNITIKYSDSGIGIEKDHLSKIFDPFFTTKRGFGGSGLGMNILYNLVTQTLHGSVKCSSSLGQGTSFTIRFPLKQKI